LPARLRRNNSDGAEMKQTTSTDKEFTALSR